MTTVGIVGAGAAAAAATATLEAAGVDADVTVFEKSGGLCGRSRPSASGLDPEGEGRKPR